MSDGAWLIITGLLLTVVVLLGERLWYFWCENQRLSAEVRSQWQSQERWKDQWRH